MAYIQITSTTESTISARMTGLDTSWNEGTRTVYWYIDGVMDGTSTLPNGVSSGGSYTFRGLEPSTDYEIQAEVKAATGLDIWFSETARTDDPEIQVDPWSWTSSNGSASSAQTQRAYDALFDHGYLSDFSYLVWNDLCDKVQEVLDATGDSWDSEYASYNATRMSSNNRQLTARRFNSLRFNIGSHESTGIQEVSKGDTVYGWYFTTLANSLNRWINNL